MTTTTKPEPFDVDSLTLGETGKIEELSNLPITAVADENAPKGKLLAAIIYVVRRRTDPKYTLEAAGRIPIGDAMRELGLVADDDEELDDEGKGDASSETSELVSSPASSSI